MFLSLLDNGTIFSPHKLSLTYSGIVNSTGPIQLSKQKLIESILPTRDSPKFWGSLKDESGRRDLKLWMPMFVSYFDLIKCNLHQKKKPLKGILASVYNEETEIQRSQVLCPESPDINWHGLGLKPCLYHCKSDTLTVLQGESFLWHLQICTIGTYVVV